MEERRFQAPQAVRYTLEGTAVLMLLLLVAAMGVLYATRPPLHYRATDASSEATVRAEVLTVEDEQIGEDENGMVSISQQLRLRILSAGKFEGREVEVTYNGLGPALRDVQFHAGDKVVLMAAIRPDGTAHFAVADRMRLEPLALLLLFFVLLTVAVGRWQGVSALVGLVLSFVVIGGFILPQILGDRDPVLVAVVGSATLLAITLYFIQGWGPITHTALLGMMASLFITGLLAIGWTSLAHLTGFGSEETMYLQATGVRLDMRGLFLAGVIIGAAGVLDDVVLAQAVGTFELAAVNPALSTRELYRRGMKMGNAHLASMVNTLVLAYTSTALPLLILFYLYTEPWYLTLNRELIAEELVRMLVGSAGLILAVPITTALAAWVAPRLGSESR